MTDNPFQAGPDIREIRYFQYRWPETLVDITAFFDEDLGGPVECKAMVHMTGPKETVMHSKVIPHAAPEGETLDLLETATGARDALRDEFEQNKDAIEREINADRMKAMAKRKSGSKVLLPGDPGFSIPSNGGRKPKRH